MYENLMEAVVTDEHRTRALEAVKRNKGAAGIDRMTTRRSALPAKARSVRG